MNSSVSVPARGSAFNVKGLRKGVKEEYVREVFSTLLPGSFICLWDDVKCGKTIRRLGRVSVSSEIMNVYPEFKKALENPGQDVRVDIGPFELTIWTRKQKKKRGNAKKIQKELELVREELAKQQRLQEQTQAMLDHLLEPNGNKEKETCVNKKRHPKMSPVHKRVKVIQHDEEMIPVEKTEEEIKAEFYAAVKEQERKIRPTLQPNKAILARLASLKSGIT